METVADGVIPPHNTPANTNIKHEDLPSVEDSCASTTNTGAATNVYGFPRIATPPFHISQMPIPVYSSTIQPIIHQYDALKYQSELLKAAFTVYPINAALAGPYQCSPNKLTSTPTTQSSQQIKAETPIGLEATPDSSSDFHESSGYSTDSSYHQTNQSLSEFMNHLQLNSTPNEPQAIRCVTPVTRIMSPTSVDPFQQDSRWFTAEAFTHNDPYGMERAALMNRNAASICEATCTWSGQLPVRNYRNPTYSCKIFLGGVPWDITEGQLISTFKPFGEVVVDWPGKESKYPKNPPSGYVYLIFENEKAVKGLLLACTADFSNGTGNSDFYYKITSKRTRAKEVQVIPWILSDSNFVRLPSTRLDPSRTVFVGALHGMLNAEVLCNIMNDLFSGVMFAGIDTDKYRYPIGSGRVTFNNHRSYMKAVTAAFIEIKTPKFIKKIQVDPFLEDSLCHTCRTEPGPFFCRESTCFTYFCQSCWLWHHSIETLQNHRPLMRNQKHSSTATSSNPNLGNYANCPISSA